MAVVLASAIGLLVAQSASAATTTVGCSGLQAALNSAANGDVVKLDQLCTDQSFTITNTNAFTLEGASTNDGFNGNSSNTPILGSDAAVRLTIKNLLFENASQSFGGGTAIQFDADGIAVNITSDTFEHLTTPTYGGAIQIEDNTDGAGSPIPTVISNNKFENNSAGDGGAIYWSNGGPLELLKNTFTGNTQTSSPTFHYPVGGAVDIENYEGMTGVSSTWLGAPITIAGNTFGGTAVGAGNSALGAGGALFVSVQGGEGAGEPAQTVTLTNNKFIDNEVKGGVNYDLYGGAVGMAPQVREFGFRVTQSGNLFQGNHITGALTSGYGAGGGAEWGIGVPITSTRDKFLDNQVNVTGATAIPPLGGALGLLSTHQNIAGASSTTLVRASFTGADDLFRGNSDPSTDGWGGAIYTGGVTSINCTSPAACPSSLALYDSTITGNSVPASGGEGAAIWGGPADSLTLENSIVYGNKGVSGAPEIFGYSKPKFSYDDACTVAGGKKALTGKGDICANPELTTLGLETIKSPTIDRGSNALVPKGLTTDLAGHRRITEGKPSTCRAIVDMGAYESKAVKPARACLVPVNVKRPQITGKPQVGGTLACSKGSWTKHPTHYRYQWKRHGKTIHGATKSKYTVQAADKGHRLTCTVLASNKKGTSKPATSATVHVT